MSAETLSLAHCAVLAAIHQAAFPPDDQWDEGAWREMLQMPGAFGFLDPAGGLVLARRAGEEGEILSLATHPAVRRRGLARALLMLVIRHLDGWPIFLEVEDSNCAALTLYRSLGFVDCGRRPDYYGPGRSALVLRRPGAADGVSACG